MIQSNLVVKARCWRFADPHRKMDDTGRGWVRRFLVRPMLNTFLIDPQRLIVWLDAYGREQINGWTPATPLKGAGARDKTNPEHDLQWVGESPAGGDLQGY